VSTRAIARLTGSLNLTQQPRTQMTWHLIPIVYIAKWIELYFQEQNQPKVLHVVHKCRDIRCPLRAGSTLDCVKRHTGILTM
jgi:hypothetical protein